MKNLAIDESIEARIQKTQARFRRVRNPEGRDSGTGEFFLLIEVVARQADVYIPLSIASGKKVTGFVYQIEGTAQGDLSMASISAKGTGITQVTLGTILYCKIPKGKTATFRILIEIKGRAEQSYRVVIGRIHYKHNPNEARYQRFLEEISSKTLQSR